MIKNANIEKKANYLEMKINPFKPVNNQDESHKSNDKNNDVVNFKNYEPEEKKKKKYSFFWPNR